MRYSSIPLVLAALLSVGCEGPRAASENVPNESASTEQPQPIAEAPAAAPQEMVREQATVGVGKHATDIPVEPTAGDIITTPVKVYFSVQDQLVFNVQLPQSLDLYKASEGHSPRSEEEFFDKVIKANQIQLPELPVGHRYVYDVEKEQLQVEHPR